MLTPGKLEVIPDVDVALSRSRLSKGLLRLRVDITADGQRVVSAVKDALDVGALEAEAEARTVKLLKIGSCYKDSLRLEGKEVLSGVFVRANGLLNCVGDGASFELRGLASRSSSSISETMYFAGMRPTTRRMQPRL